MNMAQMFILYSISVGIPLADWWRMLHRRLTMALMMNSPRHPSSAAWLVAVIFCDAAVVNDTAKAGNARPSVTAETEEQAMQNIKMTWKLNKKVTADPTRSRTGGVALYS